MSDLAGLILKHLEKIPEASSFVARLMEKADLRIFGGVPRDFLFYGALPGFRDLDLVVEFKDDKDSIGDFISSGNINARKNRYGGWKLGFGTLEMDIWELKDTWAFRSGLLSPSWENLVKSVYLNTDAFACPLSGGAPENSWPEIRKTGLIDIVTQVCPFEKLNILRAIIHAERYGLDFSPKLRARVVSLFPDEKAFVSEMMTQQLSHYGCVMLGAERLGKEFGRLRNCLPH